MFDFITGPLIWITFAIFIGGSLFKLISAMKLARQDAIVFPRMGLSRTILSLSRWLAPYTSRTVRVRPVLTLVTVIFHLCILATPVLLFSHSVLWYQSWNISWWTLPEPVTDMMTLIVVLSCFFFLLRRLALPSVQQVTSWKDYAVLAVTAAPFITGLLAYHQWIEYKPILIAHILSGQVMLLAIPFTRLGHMIFFLVTRGYIGSEYGREGNPRV